MQKTDILATQQLYKQQAVNDLSWLIHSPSLLSDKISHVLPHTWWPRNFPNMAANFTLWDDNPCLLPEKITNPKPVIGDYFEDLVAFMLTQLPQVTQLRRRKTVFENKRTIGEFDFLFHDLSCHCSYHWEVAIKFYLYHESKHGFEFYGPNSRDYLSKKVERICQQQILLSEKPAAETIIAKYPKPLIPQIMLKGFLFYPSSQWDKVDNLQFDYISPNHLHGWWTYAHQPEIPKHDDESKWVLLTKPYWLTVTSHCDLTKSVLTYEELKGFIKTHFQRKQTPLFLAEVMQNTEREYIECSRGFIVPPTWPNSN